MKIINYIFLVISTIDIIASIILIIMGNQPCSGDGCMIHFLYILGTIILLPSAIIFYITRRNIMKLRKSNI